MADREKVIEALKRCIYDPDPGQLTKEFLSCSECPYCHGCTHDLMRDVLVLLKEQEARVLTWEEVENCDDWVWIDRKSTLWIGLDEGWVTISYYDKDDDTIWFNDRTFGTKTAYNKLWRCWTRRPSDEQRQNTLWEGENDA